MILLYADDPGAVNYLAPIASELKSRDLNARFVVDPRLASYTADRQIAADIRVAEQSPSTLLDDADVLVVGTSEDPRCFGHQLTAAARRAALPTLGVIDLQVNAENRFRGETDRPLAFAPEYLAVPDESAKHAFARLGFAADHIFICGHPHYDRVRERREQLAAQPRAQLRAAAFPDAPAGRPIWLFAAEGVDQLDPRVSFRSPEYTLAGWGGSDFRGAIVLEEIIDAAARVEPRPWMVLRLHPKNRRDEFASCLSRIDRVSDGGDPLPLVWSADLTLGMTSMLLVEACLLERPHAAVLPRESERAWLPTLASGITPVATTAGALEAIVASGPPVAPRDRIDAVLPQNSVPRATAAVLTLISRRKPCSQQ